MAEVPDTVDDAVDLLSGTPTTDEVFLGTRDFSSRELASSAVARGAGGGGSQPQIIDVELTTDPDTFLVNWDYDFGQVTPLFVSSKVTALDGDGETWGDGPGEISVRLGSAGGLWQAQRDDVPTVPGWTNLSVLWAVLNLNSIDTMDTVGQYNAYTFVVPQCLRLLADAAGIVDDNGDPYAGANHPTATFRLYVEYLT